MAVAMLQIWPGLLSINQIDSVGITKYFQILFHVNK